LPCSVTKEKEKKETKESKHEPSGKPNYQFFLGIATINQLNGKSKIYIQKMERLGR
jgi:hypothetical protein